MKAWKIVQLVGFLMLAVGVIARAGAGEFWGIGLATLGVVVYAVGRVGAWLKSEKP